MSRWQIITGAPCSGKTTVIEELARQGYKTEGEVARKFLNILLEWKKEHHLTRKISQVQYAILEAKMARERRLNESDLVFFDRGIPDSIAYFEFNNLDCEDVITESQKTSYENVFYLEPLPLKQDDVRKESTEEAAKLARLLLGAYQSVGYHPIIVPVMAVEERVEMILSHC